MSAPSPAPIPPPGSDAAIAAGCTCPVLDNAHGAGVGGRWWVSFDCPLHGADTAALGDLTMRPRQRETPQSCRDDADRCGACYCGKVRKPDPAPAGGEARP